MPKFSRPKKCPKCGKPYIAYHKYTTGQPDLVIHEETNTGLVTKSCFVDKKEGDK